MLIRFIKTNSESVIVNLDTIKILTMKEDFERGCFLITIDFIDGTKINFYSKSEGDLITNEYMVSK
jgi:hypothetical protein